MEENELKLHLAVKALDNLRNISIKGYLLNWDKIEKIKKELLEAALTCFELNN